MNKRILIILIAIIFLFGALILIKYLNNSYPKPEFSEGPNDTVLINSNVVFTCSNIEDSALSWNLGDGNSMSGNNIEYQYKVPGKYSVIASIDAMNSDPHLIVVVAPAELKIIKPKISVPPKIIAGETVTFEDRTEGSNKWSWRFAKNRTSGNFKGIDVTFSDPGRDTLIVSVEGEAIKGSDTLAINIEKPKTKVVSIIPPKPKPPKPPKQEVKAPVNNPKPCNPCNCSDDFILRFQAISEGLFSDNSDASEEWGTEIIGQACDGQINITVNYSKNGKITASETKTANGYKNGLLFKSYKLIHVKNATGKTQNCCNDITLEVESLND